MPPEKLSGEPVNADKDLFLDKTSIMEVVNRYFYALDSKKFELMQDVFSEDANYVAQLVDGSIHEFHGRSKIIDACRSGNIWRTSHHGARNLRIEIDGQNATANIYAMDALLDDRKLPGDISAGARLIQHGLRYIDQLKKGEDGWRITRRKLICLWQHVVTNPTMLPDSHFGALPDPL